ncbi:MAG: bifunctional DNA-formamidopyrimidine glycosylase/DNA-(apurinic or apyrimidinic site) lyase [Candidatus Coatesbacteria bacterium]|nr:bifunctional DNA-formamidopyrimidine glycosylase/DNA-(apurinic or apyrimidinic site) lyase [Candidatus Coatesbacteria bacterium]
MPELPEVETIVRQLAPRLRGRRLTSIELLDPKLELPGGAVVTGSTVRETLRLGKRVVLELIGGEDIGVEVTRTRWLAFHLRMTGRLSWLEPGGDYLEDHLRALLRFDGGNLLFHDVRRFGTLSLHHERADAEPAGLDPLSDGFTVDWLAERLAATRQQIKVWLLRQDRLAGLGNIYASEILFAAGISPFTPAQSLEYPQIEKLHHAVVDVLRRAVENRGTTFSDYRDAAGERGGFQERLAVYGRENERCPRCGSPVLRCVQCQRSTFYCPDCQGSDGIEL